MSGGMNMQLIQPEKVQQALQLWREKPLYLHLEMTTGAYASHRDKTKHTASAFVTNTVIRYAEGSNRREGTVPGRTEDAGRLGVCGRVDPLGRAGTSACQADYGGP